MIFGSLLARFDGASAQSDGGYLARCPAHTDSRPSLRIWRGDDQKVRITCRAGCDTADVIAAVGLTWPDLFDSSGPGSTVSAEAPALVSGDVVAELAAYLEAAKLRQENTAAASYLLRRFGLTVDQAASLGVGFDDDSEHLFRFPYRSRPFLAYPRVVVPLVGFDGIARGAQGRDISGECPMRWVGLSNPDGQRWAAYGHFKGAGGYPVVVITEGPGDGLTAAALGYDVILIRGAALAANPELCEEIANGVRGRLVIAAGDNDLAGKRFNEALAAGLRPFGISVRALEIPDVAPRADITKWRESDPAGFPIAFHSAIRNAPIVAPQEVSRSTGPEADDTAGRAVDSPAETAVAVVEQLAQRYGASDVLNAHVLAALHPGRIKYTAGLGFMAWNGRFWESGDTRVRQLIHQVGAALGEAAAEAGGDAGKGLRRVAKGFTVTRHINDLLRELRAVPDVYAETGDFDARPDLLNFANGVVDLRTGAFGPHDPAHMLTYALDIEYKPEAKCPRWSAFLAEIFEQDPDLVPYVQRLVGYAITGHTSEQAFAVLWGKGANGKSVFTDTLTHVFRAVSRTTPFATFEERASGGIPNDIAALHGSRLVMASEGESGRPMSESVLKRLSGKDMISARFLNREFFEFKPSFLIMLATNHKPRFRGQDEGLWRRVKMIPFRRYFAPHERDTNLDVALMAEAEGIAAWAVAGSVSWFAAGLDDPPVIKEAVKEYKETSDALAGFFPGELVPESGASMAGNEAFSVYLDWCEAENLPDRERWKRTTFYSAMEERGIGKSRNAKGVVLVGVRSAHERPGGSGIFGKDEQ